ncbi:glycerate kinase [Leptolyngbya sp. AN02str]|uniref:glycerate kinase n=1 Tax=Leptolyngbya sp. AN02str TaxID=3423363 RepID=UPI003D318591
MSHHWNQTLASVLADVAVLGSPTVEQRSHLQQHWMTHIAQPLCLPTDQAEAWITQQVELWPAVFPELQRYCVEELGWEQVPMLTAWDLWLPLALSIAERQRSRHRPIVQGFLGGQGTGKTTLTCLLSVILQQLGFRVCSLSIDDLYKTYAERQALLLHDPRLRWRGPPGTHDVELGVQLLQQFKATSVDCVMVPRFDKSAHNGAGDRTQPEPMQAVDIVLFEGWFVGMQPIDPQQFDQAPEPIVTESDRAFARDCNTRLATYLPLWDQLDSLLVLRPQDYRLSQRWRTEAEHDLKRSGRSGMSDDDIRAFVEYFWKALHPELFLPPLLRDSNRVDLVVDIGADHQPVTLWRPVDTAPTQGTE